jgi:polysaccharide export outer membrane protein
MVGYDGHAYTYKGMAPGSNGKLHHPFLQTLPQSSAAGNGPVSRQTGVGEAGKSTRNPGAAEMKIKTQEEPDDAYSIGVGDLLEISVWKNPDLSVTVPVRPDGRISVPLVGEIKAAGMTPLALRQSLTDGYREYVTAPEVSVLVKEIRSQKVFVTGEVATPGSFDLQPKAKLMQIIAMAGGLTPYAKGRVIVLRDRGGRERRYELDLGAIISGRRPQDNLTLQPGDTLVVP